MPQFISVQFSPAGKLYDFSAGEIGISVGDHVIVETERGVGIARVMKASAPDTETATGDLAAILRKATPDDLAVLERNQQKEREAFEFCLRRIVDRNMQMKLVRVEYLFDGSKAVFFFTADGRIDFRDLVKDLAHNFHTRIEMRQIGVRDESKMVGGIGICGRELCCSSWLRDFQPVSVKMAKEQNLALNPAKISGQCGRLLCCLDYEYETYCCLRKSFPKCGKRVRTASVAGVVDKQNLLTGMLTLKLDDGKLAVVRHEELLGDTGGDEPVSHPAPKAPGQQEPQGGGSAQRRESGRPPQPDRSPQRPEEGKKVSGGTPPRAPAPVAESGEPRSGKRKHRNRRHGHRKAGDQHPQGSETKNDSNRSEP